MTELRLGDLALRDDLVADLHGVVAVRLRRLDARHDVALLERNHRRGHDEAVGREVGHHARLGAKDADAGLLLARLHDDLAPRRPRRAHAGGLQAAGGAARAKRKALLHCCAAFCVVYACPWEAVPLPTIANAAILLSGPEALALCCASTPREMRAELRFGSVEFRGVWADWLAGAV